MTDAELVRRARDGQRTAQEQLVRRWSPRVLAVCRARIGRAEAAEDLAQEALLRGLTRLDALEHPERLGAWLRGIAVRVCLDWLRSRSREHVPLSSMSTMTDGFASVECRENNHQMQIEEREQQECLLAEVDALSEDLREPLLLYYYDNVTYEQIGEMIGVSRATVNSRLAKARAQLARRLAHLTR